MGTKEEIRRLLQSGNTAAAERLCRELIGGTGRHDSQAWLLMAAIQAGAGNPGAVESCCRKATEIDPRLPAAYFNLGIAQQSQGQTDAAMASFLKTLEIDPTHSGAHASIGMLALNSRDATLAVRHLGSALSGQPDNPALHYYLGKANDQLGNRALAEQHYKAALQRAPDDPRINNDLGNIMFSGGRTAEAVRHFRMALKGEPESFIIHYNLGIALWKLGRNSEAFPHSWRAIKLSPDSLPARQSFVQVAGTLSPQSLPPDAWEEIAGCFRTRGVDGQMLVPLVTSRFCNNRVFGRLYQASLSPDTAAFTDTLLIDEHLPLLNDRLLLELLSHAVITSHELEQFLTMARKALLYLLTNSATALPAGTTKALKSFLPALAAQCFLNEYAWFISPEESRKAGELRDELEGLLSGGATHDDGMILRILLLAAYAPLYTLNRHAREMTMRSAPLRVCAADLVAMQIDEPEQERSLSENIITLTPVSDPTSRAVREQYEASPYPRWANVTLHSPRSYTEVLGEIFPHAGLPDFGNRQIEMLVAGCGTGKHPLQSATRFRDVQITAMDLSRASLAYAMRKAQEYGIRNIRFCHGDILQLNDPAMTYDIIESIGVLHHMNDPPRGLKILVDRLAPGGLINIGLYSSCARRNIRAARELLHNRGFMPEPADIRAARREIARLDRRNPARQVLHITDFYSLSECRDLLFHVQEHTYTLEDIGQLIGNAGLVFIGFEFPDNATLPDYKRAYSDDPAATNLHNWHRYEQDHPDTFTAMYTFWCRKQQDS